MGWFERKLMVVSVVFVLRNMSVSRLDGFRIMSRQRKLIHSLFSCVPELYVCMYLVYICIYEVRVGSFGVIYNYNIIYITCV